MKVKWLDRALLIAPVHFCLVLSEQDYQDTLQAARVPVADWGEWILPNCSATVSYFAKTEQRDALAVVSMRDLAGRSGVEIAGLLVHEAVHVFQRICRLIGEDQPSAEFEAYSIQWIAQELMQSYADQRGGA